ncbi:MAG TPA: hypothetical protein VGP72_01435 [Planctomycetota bacterium]|jgi:hypothetical protein
MFMPPPYSNSQELRQASVDEFIEYLRAFRTGHPKELLEIHYLMASMDTFRWLEIWSDNPFVDENWDPKSPQVQEIIARLLDPENRPGLRAWYSFHGAPNINCAAERFRRFLSKKAGEQLGEDDAPKLP